MLDIDARHETNELISNKHKFVSTVHYEEFLNICEKFILFIIFLLIYVMTINVSKGCTNISAISYNYYTTTKINHD